VAGFLGAGISTAIHSLFYVYVWGYIEKDMRSYGIMLVMGFLFGGLSDLMPSREWGLNDNFTTIIYGCHFWWIFAKFNPGFFRGMEMCDCIN